MINWPASLIAELAARRCIVFLGAGVSRAATRQRGDAQERPPDWTNFLRQLRARANRGTEADLAIADQLLNEGKLLDCAEILKACIQAPDYHQFIRDTFSRYHPTDIHGFVNTIDQKIVITTNFDTLYEEFCQQGDAAHGYSVLRHHDNGGFVTRLRSPLRLIVKAHGCMSWPEQTILTRSEFFKARQQHSGFFRVMESLFTTHTLIFLGYSLSDPDIQLLLENSSIAAPSEHPHYAVMARGTHPAILNAFRITYNIEVLDFDPAENYKELLESVGALAEEVSEYRETQPNE